MAMDPKLGYDNFFERGLVTVTSEDADYPKENAFDGFTDDHWKPTGTGTQRLAVDMTTAQEADYFAVASHDLYTQGVTVRLQGSTDGATWVNVGIEITPTSDSPFMVFVTATSYRHWALRFTVPVGKTVHVGAANIGKATLLPQGFFVGYAPPKLNERNVILNSESEGGEHIGRTVIRMGIEDKISVDHLDPAWVRSTWEPFRKYALKKPFFFAWYPSKYPDDVVYVWTTEDARVSNSHKRFQNVDLPLRGRT